MLDRRRHRPLRWSLPQAISGLEKEERLEGAAQKAVVLWSKEQGSPVECWWEAAEEQQKLDRPFAS